MLRSSAAGDFYISERKKVRDRSPAFQRQLLSSSRLAAAAAAEVNWQSIDREGVEDRRLNSLSTACPWAKSRNHCFFQ